MTKTILHVDINSYFATVLQQENPHLRGKPIGVIKAEGRTCLIAVSKEAKLRGIQTGSRLHEVMKLCPEIVAVPASFERYLDATQRLKKVFTQISPDVFIYSLDEAFIDITDCQKYLYPTILTAAEKVQALIKAELGEWITCNVGISHNRLLSKMASEIAPKGGVLRIDDTNKDAILAEVSFKDVCGVGYRLEKKLAALGIQHPYEIRLADPDELRRVFGPFWSQELLKIAYGEESHLLHQVDHPPEHMKSVSRSITGYHLYDDEAAIKRILYNLIEEVTYKVRRMELAGRYVWLSVSDHDRSWSAHRTLSHHIRHTSELFEVAYQQLYLGWQRQFKVIRFAVGLGLLSRERQVPRPLFGRQDKLDKVARAMDSISNDYGLFTLRSGLLLNQEVIRPEVTGFLGDRQYYGL